MNVVLPAHDVAYHIGMANNDLITILFLLWVCSVYVIPECSLNTGSILIILLETLTQSLFMQE